MTRWTTQWFLSLQIALYMFLIFVQGNKEADEAYKNGRNLVLEYFLPINLPVAVDLVPRREKRDVEGSGEGDSIFSEFNEKGVEEIDNSTHGAFAKLFLQEEPKNLLSNLSSIEGSGEIDEVNQNESSQLSSSEEKKDLDAVPIISDFDTLTTAESVEITGSMISEVQSEAITEMTSTEMIFDKSEDFGDINTEETTTVAADVSPAVILDTTTLGNYEEIKKINADSFEEENAAEHFTTEHEENTTPISEESTNVKVPVDSFFTEITTESFTEPTEAIPNVIIEGNILNKNNSSIPEATTIPNIEETKEFTTTSSAPVTISPIIVPQTDMIEEVEKTVTDDSNTPSTKETTKGPEVSSFSKFPTSVGIPDATETYTFAPTTPEPVIEEIFKETDKKLEAIPGNILQKQNLSLAADTLLITNTRLTDSEETVQLSSSEPKRLGAYIIIGLILLSFSSLVGYITFRRRMNRKRHEFESNQESNDTEKALLSLSDYKDNSELEENHLKNNEITPIVVKSNSQINKFEKNTNFASPKNLNTTANEKNIEKDNVLKSTAENLTQVIIEGSPKDVEEDKNVPNMERHIVKTRIDQDSIPKKPIIINRSSTGYVPIPQDNV